MSNDQDQLFEELAKKYPDLMKKSHQEYLGVESGWFNIIDVLCGAMYYKVGQARYKLQYAKDNPDSKYVKPVEELEAELEAEINALPRIDQIKEKFGSLRFYVSGASPEINNYIEFAEAMSSRTCEVCGAPGEKRSGSWVKTLCDKHHKEREEKYAEFRKPAKDPGPKLSDE